MHSRALVIASIISGAGALSACGGASKTAGDPARDPSGGRRCYEVQQGVPAVELRNPKRLDPELRTLFALHRTETVRVTIEFGGELADLETVGFAKDSVVANPDKGYKIATGKIPIEALEALSNIDHVVLVSAPQPIYPVDGAGARDAR